jgi:hypothetical protein
MGRGASQGVVRGRGLFGSGLFSTGSTFGRARRGFGHGGRCGCCGKGLSAVLGGSEGRFERGRRHAREASSSWRRGAADETACTQQIWIRGAVCTPWMALTRERACEPFLASPTLPGLLELASLHAGKTDEALSLPAARNL